VLAAEAVVEVDEAVVVEIEADNIPVASLEVAVALDEAVELELTPAHQIMPPIMAKMIIPDITYMLAPIDVSDFI
jgi:hypothetical protein